MNESTYNYTGACGCGKCTVEISLPCDIARLTPRACDCDFCTQRSIQYLSVPDGRLTVFDSSHLTAQKQGSNQAEFLTCNQCQTVIAVVLKERGICFGAVNATILADVDNLQPAVPVSPKLLSSVQKKQRWQEIWMPTSIVLN